MFRTSAVVPGNSHTFVLILLGRNCFGALGASPQNRGVSTRACAFAQHESYLVQDRQSDPRPGEGILDPRLAPKSGARTWATRPKSRARTWATAPDSGLRMRT